MSDTRHHSRKEGEEQQHPDAMRTEQSGNGHRQTPHGAKPAGNDVLGTLREIAGNTGKAAKQVEKALDTDLLDPELAAKLKARAAQVKQQTGVAGKVLGLGEELTDGKTGVVDAAEGALKGNGARHAVKGTTEGRMAKKALTATGVSEDLLAGNKGKAVIKGIGLTDWNPTELAEAKARNLAEKGLARAAEHSSLGLVRHPVVRVGVPAVAGLVGGLVGQEALNESVAWAGEQMPKPLVDGYDAAAKTVGEIGDAAYKASPPLVQTVITGADKFSTEYGKTWGEIFEGVGSQIRALGYDAMTLASLPFGGMKSALHYANEARVAENQSAESFGKFGSRVEKAAEVAGYLVGLKGTIGEGVEPSTAVATQQAPATTHGQAVDGKQTALDAARCVNLSGCGVTRDDQAYRAPSAHHLQSERLVAKSEGRA